MKKKVLFLTTALLLILSACKEASDIPVSINVASFNVIMLMWVAGVMTVYRQANIPPSSIKKIDLRFWTTVISGSPRHLMYREKDGMPLAVTVSAPGLLSGINAPAVSFSCSTCTMIMRGRSHAETHRC